jgi:UDP-N-acetylmuramate dehydrogenase
MADKNFGKIKTILPGIQKGVLLKDHTTFKIGGPASYFFVAKNKEDLIKAIKISKSFKLPLFIIGGGSNILVSDKGFKGLVIKIQFSSIEFQDDKVISGAGVGLTKLANLSAEMGLSGFEWAAGIPGTVGGAVYGCAQAFGDKISDTVENVEALDINTLKFKNFSNKQCNFSLKNSLFKTKKNLIIIYVSLKLKNGNKKEISEKIKEYISYRKKHHPVKFPSAGSVFVNPENKDEIIRASSLIEICGLKGKKAGKAEISKIHSNFIVNLGEAKAKDVLTLINLAKKKVKKNSGIDLETEIQMVGFEK